MRLPELMETAPVSSATAIEFAPVLFPPDMRWSTVWRTADGGVWAQTARDHEAFFVRITGFADFRITPAAIHVAANATARESTIRHLLLDQVLPLALAAEGRLVLHASAVYRDTAGI